jgi:hypothetical protein
MRKRKEGDTLSEKLVSHLAKINKDEQVSHINDAFYVQEMERGTVFYVRRNDFMSGKRHKNVVDEVEQ